MIRIASCVATLTIGVALFSQYNIDRSQSSNTVPGQNIGSSLTIQEIYAAGQRIAERYPEDLF